MDNKFLSVTHYVVDKLTVIVPIGEIRANSFLVLREVFAALEKSSLQVALDLMFISALDSSGIGLIVNFTKRLRTRGGELFLCNYSTEIEELLEMAGINQIVPMHLDLSTVKEIVNR